MIAIDIIKDALSFAFIQCFTSYKHLSNCGKRPEKQQSVEHLIGAIVSKILIYGENKTLLMKESKHKLKTQL